MRVLVVGGSGKVGSLIVPALSREFEVRVYDRVSPAFAVHRFIEGDVTDPERLVSAAEGMDCLLYMAMGSWQRGAVRWVEEPAAAYDVNVRGLHFALAAAVKAGVGRAIYTSSLSVYDGQYDLRSGLCNSEETSALPTGLYGFTKRLGEQVCEYFTRAHNLPTMALRLFLPVSQEVWQTERREDERPDCRTSGPDLARAVSAAIRYQGNGFEIVHITGDDTGRAFQHEKAGRLLGWAPAAR
ncbi:MAG TPA: NAD(P)-dependent oxidoreductase, partial [Chthonomonadales bacterium]|nr:NAD(P)-dependent oxidoreductase [Chthonomonadales bacterium]